jgi:hypothetical protein
MNTNHPIDGLLDFEKCSAFVYRNIHGKSNIVNTEEI